MNSTCKSLASAALAALGIACAPQASDEYLGEPLLRMRGHVTTSGLTIPQSIAPALCFEELVLGTLGIDALPDEIRATFEGAGFGAGSNRAHILDVEVEGEFPAEFGVNAYVPPPQAAIAPLFAGEPPSAWGHVCAVQNPHDAVAENVSGVGATHCTTFTGPCQFTNVLMTASGSRYYAEQADCPTADAPPEECTTTRSGEVALLTETGGFEHVVAQAFDPELVYLAAPAPAGSYTAYKLGAPDGLPAGYHLRTVALGPEEDLPIDEDPTIAVLEQAVAETNAELGTSYPTLPDYFEGTSFHYASPEVVDTYNRILARLEMERIPMPKRSAVSPDQPGLTLELVEQRDWFPRRPPLIDLSAL